MNEQIHFFIRIYLSQHFILERVDVGCVWEVSWRQGQTTTYWPQVLLTIAALLSYSGWAAQPWVTEGRKPLVCKLILTLASCPPTDSNWNWSKPSVEPGYIIVLHPPASAVPPLIYTGASLDWRLDWGSIYNNGSVLHHLIRMALKFFNFSSKVGEIIMKYFNLAFMKFTIKNYTTKWPALEIGIMMSCVISPFLFVLAMELILWGAANTSKGVMKNEHLTLPPSRAFMNNITIFVPSQIAADYLLQRYYDLLTWVRMKAKPKKSRSLTLVGGSVREIHFKIGGDKILTVREKPVKSLGCLYSIPLTDCHRGTEVQKVALKGLKSIDKTCLPRKMKA